jgi:hypothetical protein
MALAVYTSAAFSTASGLAVGASAEIEVRRESDGALASIFSDVDGTTPLANPFNADSEGRFAFYASGIAGGYRVKVTKGAEVHTLRHQAIGTAAQVDYGAAGKAVLEASAVADALGAVKRSPVARSSNTILGAADIGQLIVATGTFTQTLTAAATLGPGWWIPYRNDGAGVVTFDPNGAELIDGATTLELQAGQTAVIFCDGIGFKTVGRLALPTSAVITTRQTARLGAVDSSGYANFLGAGAGLNFNIDASPTPLVLDFAAGAVDFTSTISADASNQGSLAASNTNFVHATHVNAASVTWGSALVPPQYGYAFDRTQGALLNFNGTDASTTMLDDFGNTWTANGNAQLDTAQFKFGSSSLLLDGTGDYITSTNFTTLGDGSWEMSCWFRVNALPGVGVAYDILGAMNATGNGARVQMFNQAGTTKLFYYGSSNGTSTDIINGIGGSNTTWAAGTWYKIRFVFDALAGTYRAYLSVNGAAETQDHSTSSTARICAITMFRVGANESGVQGFNGWIDAVRFVRCAPKTGTETPAAVAPAITDYPVHFFSIPAMTMYEVTSASGSAGTNPGMTARNRVFVGEQDTNGSAVTATRCYALRGEYESVVIGLVAGGADTFSHNIGVPPHDVQVMGAPRTPVQGWHIGDWLEVHRPFTEAGNHWGVGRGVSRNVLTLNGGGSGWRGPVKAGTHVSFSFASALWNFRVTAKRGW